MAVLVRLPKLGANVGEGMVARWHAAEGRAVCRGDALVEVITSKATFDVEAPSDGVVLRVCAPEKSTVPVGYVLCVIGGDGEAAPDVRDENERALAAFRREEAGGCARGAAGGKKIRATPGARRLAKAEGVDLGDVPPGDGGSVVREVDVRKFLKYRRRRE